MSKSLTITLKINELIYDFQNKAFLTGRSRRSNGMDAEAASNIQASDDDEDRNQTLRSIQSAYGQLITEMSEYVRQETGNSCDNELIGGDDLSIYLNMPSNFALHTKDAIVNSVHDYIIAKALVDWYLITDKADAKEYSDMAALALSNLHKTFNKRVRPERKTV